jgi:Putative auto-transporter adhesin, head GIN domain
MTITSAPQRSGHQAPRSQAILIVTVVAALILAGLGVAVALLGRGARSSGSGVRGSGVDGDGQAQLSQLAARDVHAVLAGSGLIQVNATTSLDAAVPGSGMIMYSGNPLHVTTSVTGSGTVLGS